MKYEDVLKRFVTNQAQLLQDKQMKQQMRDQMYAEKAKALGSFVPGSGQTPDYGMQSPQEEYTETEHNPFEEGQEYRTGGISIDPSKRGTFKAQATRMDMSVQEAASHILANKEDYTPTMVKKANFAKNFAKEEGGEMNNDSTIKCGNCGWSWKMSNAGNDPATCHKCGTRSGKIEMSQEEYDEMKKGGEMIRRADGSYSQRGMWDNIRDNAGSGKTPTKEMLEQERRINRSYELGGTFGNPEFDSLPEAMQDRILMQMASGGYVNYNNWD